MTLLAYLAGDDHAHNIRLNDFGLTTHADGSVGFGGIVFDDPDGTLLVRGWMEVVVVEDECIDAPILFRGWVGDRQYVRQAGQGLEKRDGLGRYIDTNLVDPNDALAMRLFTNDAAKRKPETDIHRIEDLVLGGDPGGLVDLVADLGFVEAFHPRPFQDADYRGQYAKDVLDDLAGPIGRMYFVYIQQPTGELGLFYATPTSTMNTSSLSISNDMADTSDQCFYPLIDASLHLDPSEVVDVDRYTYRNGIVFERNFDTAATFFSSAATGGLPIRTRGLATSNDRVGAESTARSMAQSILAKDGVERSTLTVTVILPREKVGFIDVGQRVQVKFTHLDLEGYGDFTFVRVTARQVQQYVTNENYVVTYELSNDALRSNGGGGSSGPINFPNPPSSSLSIVQQTGGLNGQTMPAPIADGDVLVLLGSRRGSPPSFIATYPFYVDSGEGAVHGVVDYVQAVYGTASGVGQSMSSEDSDSAVGWYELSPGAVLVDHKSATGSGLTNCATADVTVPAGGIAFVVAGLGSGGAFDTGGYNPPDFAWFVPDGWTRDVNRLVGSGHPASLIGYYKNTTSAPVTITPGPFTFFDNGEGAMPWQVIVVVFGPSATATPPQPSQDVPWEVVTMTTVNGVSTGTTQFPFADRSLLVKVDGLLISTASYVEDDGLCGDFHLTWQKDASEVVTVKYQGR